MRHPLRSGWLFVAGVALYGAVVTSIARAAPPVPFYKSHVFAIEKIGDGSVIIRTRDTPDAVHAWYRKNIRDANGETKTQDGSYILYTGNGATVDIEPGDPPDAGASIGIVWNAMKYGAYSSPGRERHAGSDKTRR